MDLKVIICSALFLMPAYGDGDIESKNEPVEIAAEDGKEGEHHSSMIGGQVEEKKEPFGNKWFVITGNAGFVTDYIYRGATQTFGGPAVQAELTIAQKREEGFYAGLWGSNVDGTTANNGSGLEADFYAGYAYKVNPDFALNLQVRDSRYPGAYNAAQSKDSFDQLEIIPALTYKYFKLLWAYCLSNVAGINQNFVQGFFYPLNPNGNTKGSWYGEASVNYPIPGTEERLKVQLIAGYWKIRNYNMLSYAVFGGGVSYTTPDSFGGLIFSVNGSATTGRKKYYTNINLSGQSKNIIAPVVWAGVMKKF